MSPQGSPEQAEPISAPGATVRDAMRPAVMTVEKHAHLAAAAYLMKHSGDSALVVTTDDEQRRPLALITDADISQAVADGLDLEQTRIEDLTRPTPVTVGPTTAADAAIRTMLLNRIHHLPVVDGDRLLGIVDIADLCRVLMPDAVTPA